MSLKTHKATVKRFRITKTGKIKKKRAGQDHFNARETGKVRRNKRRLQTSSPSDKRAIKQLVRK